MQEDEASGARDAARTSSERGGKAAGGQGVRACLRELERSEGRAALFAGWRARLVYNGVLVAALVPLRSLGYYGLRDAVILEIFTRRR